MIIVALIKPELFPISCRVIKHNSVAYGPFQLSMCNGEEAIIASVGTVIKQRIIVHCFVPFAFSDVFMFDVNFDTVIRTSGISVLTVQSQFVFFSLPLYLYG